MSKKIVRIVLTGGPAAGKTSLISRILNEFQKKDGWRVITIPETATELISGFGLSPYPDCMSMYNFQYFVISDQLHKEQLALKGAEAVPEDNVLIVYDRAVFDDKAYVSDEDFHAILSSFGKTEEEVLAGYDAVLHLVTCAKGAESAYNLGNAARSESVEFAREMDDRTLRAWSQHPSLYVIDNSVNFEDKLNRAMSTIYGILGSPAPSMEKRKYLIRMPDTDLLVQKHNACAMEMMQTYLTSAKENVERRIRQRQINGGYLYFYTEKTRDDAGTSWVTQRPISEREYVSYLMDADTNLHAVRKTKYSFNCKDRRMEIDVYPFSADKAILFVYEPLSADPVLPPEVEILQVVTDDLNYKNRHLALTQEL